MSRKKIGIVGVGWVGGISRRWFLSKKWKEGYNLLCYDKYSQYKNNVDDADIVFICVPTPSDKGGRCDISKVEEAIERFSGTDKLVVIKSTVEPGTTERLAEKHNVKLVINPEFLTEKNAWNDFINPDRQIIGYTPMVSQKDIELLFSILPKKRNTLLLAVPAIDAEIGKSESNNFGAMKVTFANQVYSVCSAVGANYENVRKIVSGDKRIGDSWMDVTHGSYRGFGGSCFLKDMRASIAWIDSLWKKWFYKDRAVAGLLLNALHFFHSIYHSNEELLKSQGLTTEDVDGHIDEERMKKLTKKKRSKK